MPKRKETEDEVPVDMLGLIHKKHKKHKHKKHKKKKGLEEGDDGSGGGSPGTPNENFKHGLKLKIKIGGQTFGEARVAKPETNEVSSDESANIDVVSASPSVASFADSFTTTSNSSKKAKKVDEEDAWLEALEEGRLEEVDEELRRMKDPNLMTARQRSLLESKAQKEKEEITPVVTETVVLSEEMIQKKIIKAKKRKEQAEEKMEKDKKQTLERLLKKSDTKARNVKKYFWINDIVKGNVALTQDIKNCALSLLEKCGITGLEVADKYDHGDIISCLGNIRIYRGKMQLEIHHHYETTNVDSESLWILDVLATKKNI